MPYDGRQVTVALLAGAKADVHSAEALRTSDAACGPCEALDLVRRVPPAAGWWVRHSTCRHRSRVSAGISRAGASNRPSSALRRSFSRRTRQAVHKNRPRSAMSGLPLSLPLRAFRHSAALHIRCLVTVPPLACLHASPVGGPCRTRSMERFTESDSARQGGFAGRLP